MIRYIDLSHTIRDGLVTYPGLPSPVICDFFTREESQTKYDQGETFQIAKIEMVANTGTYIDVPFHRFEYGKDLARTKISAAAGLEGIVVRAKGKKSIGLSDLQPFPVDGKAVLLETGWDQHWGTDTYLKDNPFLEAEAAQYLVDNGVKLVGIDSLNIDDTATMSRPVHTVLLQNEILIVEHLCRLDQLPDSGFVFNAVPPKIEGAGSFPVRAFAQVTDQHK